MFERAVTRSVHVLCRCFRHVVLVLASMLRPRVNHRLSFLFLCWNVYCNNAAFLYDYALRKVCLEQSNECHMQQRLGCNCSTTNLNLEII